LVASDIGVFLPFLRDDPVSRTWIAIGVWWLFRFIMTGPVAMLLIPFLFFGSVGIYLFGIFEPLAFGREVGVAAALQAAVVSPDPGLFYVVRSVSRLAGGSGLSWLEAFYAWAILGSFSLVGSHLYDDLSDFMAHRFRVRAPLWALIICASIGSMAGEVLKPLTPWVHVLGLICALGFGIAVYWFGQAVKVFFGRIYRRFRHKPVDTDVPETGRDSTEGLELAAEPPQEVVTRAGPETAQSPGDGNIQDAPGFEEPDDGERTFEDVSVAAVPDGFRQPLVGVADDEPWSSNASEDQVADDGFEPRWGESTALTVNDQDGSMSGGDIGDEDWHYMFLVYWHNLLKAIAEENVEIFERVLANLSQLWVEVVQQTGGAPAAEYILRRIGSIPLGRSILVVLRDGVEARPGLQRVLSSRLGGDDEEDKGWVLDRSLAPFALSQYGTRLDEGGGDDGDIPFDGGWAKPGVAEVGSEVISAEEGECVGTSEIEPEEEALSIYDPQISFVAAAPVEDTRYALGEVGEANLRVEPFRMAPRLAAAGVAALSSADDIGVVRSLSDGPGGMWKADHDQQPSSKSVSVAEGPDMSLGVGESDSTGLQNRLELDQDLMGFLSLTAPMGTPDVVKYVGGGWVDPQTLATRLSTFVDELTPDAGQLSVFMQHLETLADTCKLADPEVLARVLLALLAMGELSGGPQLEQRRLKLAYALCGPWRRKFHADVGRILRLRESETARLRDGDIEPLIATIDTILEIFPDFSVSGSAVDLISQRRGKLIELGFAVSARARAAGTGRAAYEDTLAMGRAMSLRQSLDQATQVQMDILEELAKIRDEIQSVVSKDSVFDSSPQTDHPFVYALRDLIVRGQASYERTKLGVAAYAARKKMPADNDLLERISASFSDEAKAFIVEINRTYADAAMRPTNSRDTIEQLRFDLNAMRHAEDLRLASERLTPRQKIEREWSAIAGNPFEAIVKRKALEESTFDTSTEHTPNWAMVQMREINLATGFRAFIHDSGTPPDVKRVLILPFFGSGIDWTFDADGLVPVGGSYLRFDLKKFVQDNLVSIRSQKISDIRVLLASGNISPDVEDELLSRNLDRGSELSREGAEGKWYKGVVLLPEDLIGAKGGIGLVSGMYFPVVDMVNNAIVAPFERKLAG
jgi:hypothetical protein